RDRGLAYLHLGHRGGARHDLGRYLQLNPEAPDAKRLREHLVEASAQTLRVH
ncbi:tetratricopeptide repeat protein, partial [Xanthomonas sp. Kuri4-3]